MGGNMAVYKIERNGETAFARLFNTPSDEVDLSPFEVEVSDVVDDGFMALPDVLSGESDPFKAAEEILADHYGYVKMVDAHYTWRPGIIY